MHNDLIKHPLHLCHLLWGHGKVVVRALDFRSEGQWFNTQSLLSSCFLTKKLYPMLSLSTQVYKMGTFNIPLRVTLQWTNIPSRVGVAILSVASCYRNQVKLQPLDILGI